MHRPANVFVSRFNGAISISVPRYKLQCDCLEACMHDAWILKASGEWTASIANDLGISGLRSDV